MARPQTMSDEQRRLRGTFEKTRSVASVVQGRAAVTQILPAPDDLDPGAAAEWRVHLPQCLAAGTLSPINLVSFRGLCEVALLRRKAYRRALREPPVVVSERGSKTNPAWTAFAVTDTSYRQWLASFGLAPKAASSLPQLPVPAGTKLEVA